MKNLFFQLLFFLKTLGGMGQSLPPQQMAILPQSLEENSGMVVLSPDSILFLNDGGNPPYVYLTDSTGRLQKEVYVQGFPNVDWEELAYDGGHRFFIGDFGNNANARTDLRIGAFDLRDFLTKDSIFPLALMHMAYQRQQNFPALADERHYDMEAMLFAQDSLYLFSKNRTDPFNGKVYQYSLPVVSGNYVLSPVDSFVTGLGLMASYWITAAAYHQKSQQLLLLGYDKLWHFEHAHPPKFFQSGSGKAYAFTNFTQKEAVDFVSDSLVYLSEEASFSSVQSLHRVVLPGARLSLKEGVSVPYSLDLLNNSKVLDTLFLSLKTKGEVGLLYEIFSLEGRRVLFGKLGSRQNGAYALEIDVQALGPGSYVLNVLVNGRPNAFRFVKPYPFKN